MLKVSVIIPTYASPPDRLNDLVASLDRQTMPTEDFEVLFIDDGSPDDTWERLQAIASTRPNVHTERIENTGWPSKPRNVGIERAAGEYVVFMDHDDQLYPGALAAGYAFASENDADVLNGKETRTDNPAWCLGVYGRDRPQSIGRKDVHPLIAMNPHKLYRRKFLLENDIRFPEGGRVLWEDQFFNLQVAHHARVISTLARTPFYHWVTTAGSGSTGFLRKDPAYWDFLRGVCEATESELARVDLADQRRQLIRHQYTSRVLATFASNFTRRGETEREFIFEHCRSIQRDFAMSAFDSSLNSSQKLRAFLLQTDQRTLLEQVCAEDRPAPMKATAELIEWRDGVLHLRTHVEWVDKKGNGPALLRDGDRIMKVLSPAVQAAVPNEARDMTRETSKAAADLIVRSRQDGVTWQVPSHAEVELQDATEGAVVVTATVDSHLDPSAVAAGGDLSVECVWDVSVRGKFAGSGVIPLSTELPTTVSVDGGRLLVAFRNAKGMVSIIVDGHAEVLRRLAPTAAKQEKDGGLVVYLAGRHDGDGAVNVPVGVRTGADDQFDRRIGTLTVHHGEASLRIMVDEPEVRLRIGDRVPGGPKDWQVTARGEEVNLERGRRDLKEPAQTGPAKADVAQEMRLETLMRRVRRWGGRTLRRLGLRS